MAKKRPLTLITGASSGIGLEFAKICAKEHHDLVLVARSKDVLKKIKKELETTYKATIHIIDQDLLEEKSISSIEAKLKRKKLIINNLINNAGFGTSGLFEKLPLEKELSMISLNCSKLVELTHTFLPQVIKRKGRILNVASTAAFQPIPQMSTYAATKAFVLSFSKALHEEVESKGVSVTTLCPGPTKTNFDKVAGMDKSSLFSGPGVMDAQEVAQIGFDAMVNRQSHVVAGMQNKAGALLTKLVPMSASAKIAKKLMGKK